MLREEQIDLRRQRASVEALRIEKVDHKSRHFGEYRVTNPKTGGEYTVSLRGFDVGDNTCTCPDFKANTLGTCKHIEAVLKRVAPDAPPTIRRRKAVVTRPEVHLHYGEQLTLALHLPPRHSDALKQLADAYFDRKGNWTAGERHEEFVEAARGVPEAVIFTSAALDFIDTAADRRGLLTAEADWLAAINRGELNDILRTPLYDYQLRGAVFAACRGRAILGDDMGLGKTLQALAAAELLARLRGIAKVLVVAPASVKYQWESEIRRFTDRSVRVIEGDRPDRLEQYRSDAFYLLVNYEQVARDLLELNASQPDYVILDEAQRIKNWEAKTSRAVKKLRSRYALVLTGTPLENRLEELYSIVEFIDDRRLGPAFQFLHDHRVLDKKGNLVGYRNLESIRERLAPIMLRRTRTEVASQIPARTDSTIFVELSAEQREPYEEQKTVLARLLAKPAQSELDRQRILACLTNLRLLCNSTDATDSSQVVSPKLDEFELLIGELMADSAGHKAVVFSQWETMLRLASQRLDRLDISYAMLHGRIPAADRKEPITRFQTDPECRVFLSTDAGGTGLNLQAADTVIHLEVPWNPAVLDQRIARVHRLGQERAVHSIRFITRDSIEERVAEVVEQKRLLFSGLFDGESDEISFTTRGQGEFFAIIRQTIVGAESRVKEPAPLANKLGVASVQMLETLAELLADGNLKDTELIERARRAIAAISEALNEPD